MGNGGSRSAEWLGPDEPIEDLSSHSVSSRGPGSPPPTAQSPSTTIDRETGSWLEEPNQRSGSRVTEQERVDRMVERAFDSRDERPLTRPHVTGAAKTLVHSPLSHGEATTVGTRITPRSPPAALTSSEEEARSDALVGSSPARIMARKDTRPVGCRSMSRHHPKESLAYVLFVIARQPIALPACKEIHTIYTIVINRRPVIYSDR